MSESRALRAPGSGRPRAAPTRKMPESRLLSERPALVGLGLPPRTSVERVRGPGRPTSRLLLYVRKLTGTLLAALHTGIPMLSPLPGTATQTDYILFRTAGSD
eukprot:363769-Chlamydomonas_euryale.AAC.4